MAPVLSRFAGEGIRDAWGVTRDLRRLGQNSLHGVGSTFRKSGRELNVQRAPKYAACEGIRAGSARPGMIADWAGRRLQKISAGASKSFSPLPIISKNFTAKHRFIKDLRAMNAPKISKFPMAPRGGSQGPLINISESSDAKPKGCDGAISVQIWTGSRGADRDVLRRAAGTYQEHNLRLLSRDFSVLRQFELQVWADSGRWAKRRGWAHSEPSFWSWFGPLLVGCPRAISEAEVRT